MSVLTEQRQTRTCASEYVHSDMAVLCPGSGKWDRSSLDVDTVKAPDDAGVSFSNFDPPPDRYLFVPDIGKANLDKKPALNPRDSGLFGKFQYREQLNDTPIAPFIDDFLYLPQVSFTATDTGEVKTHGVLNIPRAPPLQVPPDKTTTYDSYNSNGSFSADESIDLGTSTALTQWSNTMDRKEPGDERQCGSIHIRANSTPLNPDKRRTLETVEPGSARAIYLEKNRQAASKCRTKQKRQHDDLVETAQEAERKNKVLKVEVELLKSDLRDLIVLAYSKQNFSLSRAIVQGPSDRKIMYHSDPSSRKPIFVRKPIAGHKQVQQSSSCKTRTLRLKGLYILTLIFLDECKASLCVENIQHNCDTYDTPWRNCLFDRVLVLVVRGND